DSSGDLSLFITARPGKERDIGALARDEVRNIILPLIADALEEDRRRAIKDLNVSSPFGSVKADIIAHPMKDDTVAVIFLAKDRLRPIVDEYEHSPVTQDRRIGDLQEELQANRLLLKSKVEEIETANEELKSSNEEMMSMNEELQSANEELTTANEELKNKIDELTLANADLDNFMQSADLAMVVLDRGLRIRHVTEAARRIMPIKSTDQGRSLGEFNVSFGKLDLLDEIHNVIGSGKAIEHTTELDADGKAYFVRITPYFFGEGTVEGASLTVVDISGEVALRQDLVRKSALLNLAMQANKMGFAEFDPDARIAILDDVGADQLGLDGAGSYPAETIFKNVVPEDFERLSAIREDAIKQKKDYTVDYRVAQPEKGTRWYKARGSRIQGADGHHKYAVISIDLTEEIQLRHNLHVESERVKLAMKAGRMGFVELDTESNEITVDRELAKQFGLPGEGIVSLNDLKACILEDDWSLLDENLARAIHENEEYEFDFRIKSDGPDQKWIRTRGLTYQSVDGDKKVVGPTIDVTAAKMAMRHQKALVDEMGHRIKNLFAVIGALVQSAPKANDDVERFAHDLIARIVSLGRAYDLIKTPGEDGRTQLSDLIRSTVEPHVSQQRLTLSGPDVNVAEDHMNTFALVLHELATNATKHGAIRHPDGEIDIGWDKTEDGLVAIHWKETVPDFDAPTEKAGFGTRLIAMGAAQLNGTFERRYSDTGAEVDLVVAL
ncbi:MAG: PAS domain-containing protein, partial [Pseudomonadota bacterium]